MTSLASWLAGLSGLAELSGRRPPERMFPDRAMTTLALAALVVTVLASAGLAQEAPTTAATLRGLTGVDVVVEQVPTEPEVEEARLGSSAVQEDIESQLREGGIRILSDEEWQAAPGRPWLFVRVQMLRPQAARRAFVYVISLDLMQQVGLARDPGIDAVGMTWRTGEIGTVSAVNVPRVRDSLRALVDTFINAYWAVNPRP